MKQVLNAPIDWPGADTPTRQNIGVLREVREAVNQNGGELETAQLNIELLAARVFPQQLIWVAKSGAQFDSIAAACDSIKDATPERRYTVLVAPGLYGGFTIPDYTSVIGVSRHDCMIQEDDPDGAVRMGNETLLKEFLILSVANPNAWGVVVANKTGVEINGVYILGPHDPHTQEAQGIRVYGNDWHTVLLTDVMIDYLGTTGYGVSIEGNPVIPQNSDCHIQRMFVDSLFAGSSGGSLHIKDCFAGIIDGGKYRTNANGTALKISETGPAKLVDVGVQGGATFQAPAVSNAHVVELGSYTNLHNWSAFIQSLNHSGTLSWVQRYDGVGLWRRMPALADYGWINHGSSTCVANPDGSWVMTQPKRTAGVGPNVSMLVRSFASGNTLTARIWPCHSSEHKLQSGLAWRASSGKLVLVGYQVGYLFVAKYDSTAALNSWYLSRPWPIAGPIWVALQDDGTLRKVWVSPDGYNWQGIHEVSRTDFLTASQAGLFVDANADTTADPDAIELDVQLFVDHLVLS
jgi:hypothetical protein